MSAPSKGKTRTIVLSCFFFGFLFMVMPSGIPPLTRRLIVYSLIGIAVLYLVLLRRVKLSIYQMGHRSETDRALRLDRIFQKFPAYGEALEGPILFNAGKYKEVQALLRPQAFDAYGKPLVTKLCFYTYCLSLVNDGRTAEAQGLLEQAVEAIPRGDHFKVALATCLLEQDKEPARACRLLEEAMSVRQNQLPADNARRIGRYAYALASCGRRAEAEAKIQEALDRGKGLPDADLAGVHYFVGEAWRALNETEKARAAFGMAITLSKGGVAMLSAQKALAKMDTHWHSWEPVH